MNRSLCGPDYRDAARSHDVIAAEPYGLVVTPSDRRHTQRANLIKLVEIGVAPSGWWYFIEAAAAQNNIDDTLFIIDMCDDGSCS